VFQDQVEAASERNEQTTELNLIIKKEPVSNPESPEKELSDRTYCEGDTPTKEPVSSNQPQP
jgi:hypothetical protein